MKQRAWKLYFRYKDEEETKQLAKTLVNSGRVIRAYYAGDGIVQISVMLGEF